MKKKKLLVLAIILIAFNMRAALTGVGVLISMIQSDLGLSSGVAGFLTTIPLLAFAAMSPAVSKITLKIGEGKSIMWGFAIMAAGLIARSYMGTFGLFLGTVLAGIGITFSNVLLPVIIKGNFEGKDEGTMTGVFSASMSFFASVAAGVSMPLAAMDGALGGWRNAMAVWVILVAIGVVFWMPFRKMKIEHEVSQHTEKLYRQPVAIWLSLFMGLQCLLFYCFVAWLPMILGAKGFDAMSAGYWFSAYQLMGIPGSLIAPILASRKRDQRGVTAVLMVLYFIGMGLLLTNGKTLVILGTLISGFCSGACISLVMLMINMRSRDSAVAAQLSGLSQSAGYIIAAAGPFLMGFLYDMTASWTLTLVVLIAIMVPMAISALESAKDRIV